MVPLSDAALAVLERVKPLRDLAGEFLFPGLKHARPLSDATLGNLIETLGYDVTAHGFRATFKTWAEQETEHANVVIEAALAHLVGDKAERAYMRGDWLAKRRLLMRDWGGFCLRVSNSTVVPYARNDRPAAA